MTMSKCDDSLKEAVVVCIKFCHSSFKQSLIQLTVFLWLIVCTFFYIEKCIENRELVYVIAMSSSL